MGRDDDAGDRSAPPACILGGDRSEPVELLSAVALVEVWAVAPVSDVEAGDEGIISSLKCSSLDFSLLLLLDSL